MLFTASGMQYFHVFNISLCGMEPVRCANNITFQQDSAISGTEPKSVIEITEILIFSTWIKSCNLICRSKR